jgi:HlyD family secretion protein
VRVSRSLSLIATSGGVLLVVVAALGVADPGGLSSNINSVASGNARARDVAETRAGAVAALGRIEPQSEIINLSASNSTPDRLDSLFVERGDLVRKGQVLGYLGGYHEQAAQIEVFQAQLDEASRKLATELETALARIEVAEIHQRQVNEVWPLRIAAQEATIRNVAAKLANDKDILTSQTHLFNQGVASRRLREDLTAVVLEGEASLASAQARLNEMQRQFEMDQIDAATQIRLAKASLERARAEFPIVSLNKQIALAQSRAERLTLFAPVNGRILNIRVKPGEQAASGPILTMGDTSKMRVVAEVYETDILSVQVGQPATVRSRSLPHEIQGKVVRVGNMIFKNDVLNVDPAARADARVVEVWIELADSAITERLTNLNVDVLISPTDGDGSRPEVIGQMTR